MSSQVPSPAQQSKVLPEANTRKRYLHSRHINDLRRVCAYSLVVLGFLLLIFLSAYFCPGYASNLQLTSAYLASFHSPTLLAASGTAIAAWAVFISRIYDVARERLGTVDIFEADITAICRIIYAVDMVTGFVVAYRWLYFYGMSSAARQESYFEALDRSYGALSSLGPVKIDAIMDFYTFLRGARDATLSFNNWVENDGRNRDEYLEAFRKNDVTHVAYLLFASLESAQKACIALMEKNEATKVCDELDKRHTTNETPESLTGLILYKYLYVRMIEKMKIQLLWLLDRAIPKDQAVDERRFWIELRLKNENLREHPAYKDFELKWGPAYDDLAAKP